MSVGENIGDTGFPLRSLSMVCAYNYYFTISLALRCVITQNYLNGKKRGLHFIFP